MKEEREGAHGDPRKGGSKMRQRDVQRLWGRHGVGHRRDSQERGRACADNQSEQRLGTCAQAVEGRSVWTFTPGL